MSQEVTVVFLAELISKLPEYFDALDRSLESIGNTTEELRDQFLNTTESDAAMAEVSRSAEQLSRIVVSCVRLISRNRREL